MPSSLSTTINQVFPGKPIFTDKDILSQPGKIFLITGGAAGLGYELTKILYQKGARIYILTRSPTKASAAISAIKSSTPTPPPNQGADIKFIFLDLADLTTIKPAVAAFAAQESKIDVLWNNAGIGYAPLGTKTKQGYEVNMGTNCLAPYLLTQLLLPYLRHAAQTASSNTVRIVFSGSPAVDSHAPVGGVPFTALKDPDAITNTTVNYAVSKTGNWFLANEFSSLVAKDGIVSICQNPGNLKTGIWDPVPWVLRKMMQITMHPPVYGAYTSLWSGLSEGITVEDGGRYVVPWGKWHPCPREDLSAAIKSEEQGGTGEAGVFWKWCGEQTKIFA